VTTLKFAELLVGVADGQVSRGHVLSNGVADLGAWEFNFGEETLSDIDQSISWPVEEVIESGTVDDTWEHTSSESEGIADWGEADTKMEILSAFVQEELKQLIWCVLVSLSFSLTSDLTKKAIKLIFGEELWNIS
jgi:hypothetical protein